MFKWLVSIVNSIVLISIGLFEKTMLKQKRIWLLQQIEGLWGSSSQFFSNWVIYPHKIQISQIARQFLIVRINNYNRFITI